MKRSAFTLIELLAAMAVFALVILAGAALVSSASGVTRTTVQRTAMREEARAIFDRLELDLSTAVRFECYQVQGPNSADTVLSMLSSTSRGSSANRLRRIDYRVNSNGLFRSVREVGWNDSQDLASISQASGELLSPAVGSMVVQSLLSDGSSQGVLSNPRVHTSPSAVGLRVGLVLAPAALRKARNIALPTAITNSGNPWIAISAEDEQKGWRVSEKVFRLP